MNRFEIKRFGKVFCTDIAKIFPWCLLSNPFYHLTEYINLYLNLLYIYIHIYIYINIYIYIIYIYLIFKFIYIYIYIYICIYVCIWYICNLYIIFKYICYILYIYYNIYIYIYITYILHICNGFVATDGLGHITYKASVITGRARFFNDYTYIMPILLLWDLSVLWVVALGTIYLYIYIYIYR